MLSCSLSFFFLLFFLFRYYSCNESSLFLLCLSADGRRFPSAVSRRRRQGSFFFFSLSSCVRMYKFVLFRRLKNNEREKAVVRCSAQPAGARCDAERLCPQRFPSRDLMARCSISDTEATGAAATLKLPHTNVRSHRIFSETTNSAFPFFFFSCLAFSSSRKPTSLFVAAGGAAYVNPSVHK